MRRAISSLILIMGVLLTSFVLGTKFSGADPLAILYQSSSADYFRELMRYIAGDWQQYGATFTRLIGEVLRYVFFAVITLVPLAFLGHYLLVGPMEFPHEPKILVFPPFCRKVHMVAAVTFSLLTISGLLMIFGSFLGGGLFIRLARYFHIGAAIIFTFTAPLMFASWVKDMLPALHDIKWVFIMGGYLSKDKKPVPAGKFNAGQKMWFWSSTVGGVVMAYTGYIIWSFGAKLDTVRIYTLVHNILGAFLVAVFLTHLYMTIFAIKGAVHSITTGYRSKAELDILHSLYEYELMDEE